MPRKMRELRADLRRAGLRVVRQKGSHERWEHPHVRQAIVTLAGNDGDDAQPYQEQDVRVALTKVKSQNGKEGE